MNQIIGAHKLCFQNVNTSGEAEAIVYHKVFFPKKIISAKSTKGLLGQFVLYLLYGLSVSISCV